jgi:CheY-like chemotaxis protein
MTDASIRVLVVTGLPRHTGDIDESLTDAGLQTRIVSDSVSAQGMLEIWQPSVAVVDLRLPADEPRQFCADVAGRPDAHRLPFVLVGEGPNLLKPSAVIPSGLVASPIDPDHLVATVLRAASSAAGMHGDSGTTR